MTEHDNAEFIKEKSLRLYESLVSGKGISHIIQTSSEVFDNPISLSDSSYRLLEYSTNTEVDDPIWTDIISSGYSTFEVVQKFNTEKVIEKVIESPLPVIINDGIGKDMTRILGKISIADKIIGYVGVFEVNHKLTKDDVTLADVLCSILSVELSKNPNISKLTGSLCENLIIDLINGPSLEDSEIDQRLKSTSWKPLDNFYLVYIPIEEGSSASYKIEYLRSYLENLSPYFKTTYLNNSVVLLMNYSNKGDLSDTWSKLDNLLQSNELSSGVSFSFSIISKIRSSFQQAQTSYSLGTELDADSSIHFYDDFYELYLLNILKNKLSLNEYCHSGILDLIQYDEKHSSSYADTLYEYMNNTYNLSTTAKKLFIHKNTMLHRLNRIREISKISSFDEEDNFKIHLTYKICKFLKLNDESLL